MTPAERKRCAKLLAYECWHHPTNKAWRALKEGRAPEAKGSSALWRAVTANSVTECIAWYATHRTEHLTEPERTRQRRDHIRHLSFTMSRG